MRTRALSACGMPGRTGVALGLAATVFVARASASPGNQLGFGARAAALAGATAAEPDGASAVFENPAGLVGAGGPWFSLGAASTSYRLETDGRPAALGGVPTVELGLVVPGMVLGVPVAFGFDLALPDARLSKLHTVAPGEPYWPLDDAGPRLLDLGLALAVRPWARVSVGVGVGFLAAARGGFRVLGTAVAADGSGAEYDSELRHAVDADLVSVRYPIFGVRFEASKELAFGAAFRGSARIDQTIAGVLEGALRLGTTDIPVRYAFETRAAVAFLPATIALAASHRPLPALKLLVELDFQAWSAYRTPYARRSATLLVEPPPGVILELPPANAPAPERARLSDRLVPRLALERSFALAQEFRVLARAGYAFERSPVPARQRETVLLDLDRHVLGLGAGAVWRAPVVPFRELRFDLGASYSRGVARTLTVGPDAAPERHRVSGAVLGMGATLGLVFGDPDRLPSARGAVK